MSSPSMEAAFANLQLINKGSRSSYVSKRRRDWSELPFDILGEIIKNLSLVDRAIFRVVCKNWKLYPRIPFVGHNTLPLLMRSVIKKSGTFWEFSVLSFSKLKYNRLTYSVQGPPEIGESSFELYDPCMVPKILCTRKGWHLIQDAHRLLFFCPFNSKIINLPIWHKVKKKYAATFSGTPDEPSDCIVFVLEIIERSQKINIATCRCGESSWRVYRFSDIIYEDFLITRVAYVEPMLYCLSTRKAVGAFNSINNEWSIPIELERTTYVDYLVETDNGDLMMVRCANSKKFKVFSFDFAKKDWKPTLDIGSRAIYLENERPHKTAFSVLVQGEAKHLANKIFYHRGEKSGCYSLETDDNEVFCQEYPLRRSNSNMWIEPPKIF